MSRPLRFIPEGGSLVEITCRTDQGRYLLRPDPVIDDILLGVLGRDIDYLYESRLPGETEPVQDIHFHPAEPRSARLIVEWRH
jgi:hypothetical protein